MPFSRHQALRLASSIAAVAMMACMRAAGVQMRSLSGAASAAARHRSSVAAEMCSSCDTTSTGALSGGSSLATALSLNAFPYLATFLVLFRPRVMEVYTSDTYSAS